MKVCIGRSHILNILTSFQAPSTFQVREYVRS